MKTIDRPAGCFISRERRYFHFNALTTAGTAVHRTSGRARGVCCVGQCRPFECRLTPMRTNQHAPPPRHLIGILLREQDHEVEQLFRKWLPVAPDEGPLPELSFVFVFGQPATPGPGRVVLPIVENMDKGKTLVWFNESVTMYSERADYIYKMDLDTGVCPDQLVRLLRGAALKRFNFLGWTYNFFNCGQKVDVCPPKDAADWEYMCGPFYGFSMKILQHFVNSYKWDSVVHFPENHKTFEDLYSGKIAFELGKPRVFDLEAAVQCTGHFNERPHGKRFLEHPTCPVVHLNNRARKNSYNAARSSLCRKIVPYSEHNRPKNDKYHLEFLKHAYDADEAHWGR